MNRANGQASGAGRESTGTLKLAEPRPVAWKPVLGRPPTAGGHLTLVDSSGSESFSSSPPDHASHWNSGPTRGCAVRGADGV